MKVAAIGFGMFLVGGLVAGICIYRSMGAPPSGLNTIVMVVAVLVAVWGMVVLVAQGRLEEEARERDEQLRQAPKRGAARPVASAGPRVESQRDGRRASEGRPAAEQLRPAPARELAPLSAVRCTTFANAAGEISGAFAMGVSAIEGGFRVALPLAFRLDLPSWAKMPSDTFELVPGKGTPMVLRLFIELARDLRLRPEDARIRELRVPRLQSLECAAEVAQARARGASLPSAIAASATTERLRFVALQCLGLDIELASVDERRKASYTVARIMDGFQRAYWDAPFEDGAEKTRREAFFERFPGLAPESRLEMDWDLTYRTRVHRRGAS